MTIKKAIIKTISFFNEEHIKQHNMGFKQGQEYLCLGFTEKEEGIVLVNGKGCVFELEYEKENFKLN